MKAFSALTEREILAVAISAEEEDSRIYSAFAEDLRERFPASALRGWPKKRATIATGCSNSMNRSSARPCPRYVVKTRGFSQAQADLAHEESVSRYHSQAG
jgi:Rubrerythrin